MALFKPLVGGKERLNDTELHEGYVYFCDDGSLFFDYKDENGVLQRKQINAFEAETLLGATLTEKLIDDAKSIPTSKAVFEEFVEIRSLIDAAADELHDQFSDTVGDLLSVVKEVSEDNKENALDINDVRDQIGKVWSDTQAATQELADALSQHDAAADAHANMGWLTKDDLKSKADLEHQHTMSDVGDLAPYLDQMLDYTKEYVNTVATDLPVAEHHHDARYYTEPEVDALLADIAETVMETANNTFATTHFVSNSISDSIADWNQDDPWAPDYIKNRICYETSYRGDATYTFDGDINGKECNNIESLLYIVKISDDVLDMNSFSLCNITVKYMNNDITLNITADMLDNIDIGHTLNNFSCVFFIHTSAEVEDIVLTPGIWVMHMPGYVEVQKIEYHGDLQRAVKISNRYLPEHSWDTLTNKPFEVSRYKYDARALYDVGAHKIVVSSDPSWPTILMKAREYLPKEDIHNAIVEWSNGYGPYTVGLMARFENIGTCSWALYYDDDAACVFSVGPGDESILSDVFGLPVVTPTGLYVLYVGPDHYATVVIDVYKNTECKYVDYSSIRSVPVGTIAGPIVPVKSKDDSSTSTISVQCINGSTAEYYRIGNSEWFDVNKLIGATLMFADGSTHIVTNDEIEYLVDPNNTSIHPIWKATCGLCAASSSGGIGVYYDSEGNAYNYKGTVGLYALINTNGTDLISIQFPDTIRKLDHKFLPDGIVGHDYSFSILENETILCDLYYSQSQCYYCNIQNCELTPSETYHILFDKEEYVLTAKSLTEYIYVSLDGSLSLSNNNPFILVSPKLSNTIYVLSTQGEHQISITQPDIRTIDAKYIPDVFPPSVKRAIDETTDYIVENENKLSQLSEKIEGKWEVIEKICFGYELLTEKPDDWDANKTDYFLPSPNSTVMDHVESWRSWKENTYWRYTGEYDPEVSSLLRSEEPDGTPYNFRAITAFGHIYNANASGLWCMRAGFNRADAADIIAAVAPLPVVTQTYPYHLAYKLTPEFGVYNLFGYGGGQGNYTSVTGISNAQIPAMMYPTDKHIISLELYIYSAKQYYSEGDYIEIWGVRA